MMKTTRMMMISEPMIRRGNLGDLEGIEKVENRAFGEHAYDHQALQYMLAIANSVTTVATVDGTIVAYATVYFRKNSSISHLESIAVDPDYQGTGIGKILIREVDRVSEERGCSRIVLETFEKNVSALNLYVRSGYKVKELVLNYYRTPYRGSRNAIRLEKSLD